MGITLTGKTVSSTYDSLLKLTDNENLTASFKLITDGLGNDSGISINNSGDVNISGTLVVGERVNTPILQLTGGSGDQGTFSWNTDEETVDLIQNGTTLQLGQETHIHVKNQTGSLIPDGTPVYATGTLGASGRITVAPMIANGSVEAKYFLGVTTEDIADGDDGKVTTFGKIRGLNTAAYTEGQTLWVSSTVAGAFQTTRPVAPNLDLEVAIVINSHVNNGTIFVRANNGHYLGTAHDVNITSVAENDLLVYKTNRWVNTKSIGDLSAANVTLSGYLRGPATFVIDPAAYGDETGLVQILGDLRVDGVTTTINSTTISVSDKNITLAKDAVTAGDANGAGITIAGANATLTYLSATDDFTFNKNVNASRFVGPLTGDVTGNADTADALSTARNIALTGSVTGNADFDGSGNITITTTTNHNHDDIYYTETESDNRFVNVSGDTMTGDLAISNAQPKLRLKETDTADLDKELLVSGGAFYIRNLNDDNTAGSNILLIDNAGNLTASGTLTAVGYNKTNWDAAYNYKINSGYFDSNTGDLVLTRQDDSTLEINFDDRYVIANTQKFNTNTYGVDSGAGTQRYKLLTTSGQTDQFFHITINRAYDYGDNDQTKQQIIYQRRLTNKNLRWRLDGDLTATQQVFIEIYAKSNGDDEVWLVCTDYARPQVYVEHDGFYWNGLTTADTPTGTLIKTTELTASNKPNWDEQVGLVKTTELYSDTTYLRGSAFVLAPNGSSYDTVVYRDGTNPHVLYAGGGTSTQWNTAYSYSQVGHLPLTGGTLGGVLNFDTSAAPTTTTAKIFFGKVPNPDGSLTTTLNNFDEYGVDGYGLILQAGYGDADMGGIKITDDGVIVFGAADENLFTVINEDGDNVWFNINGVGQVTIADHLYVNGGNSTQWNTAYSWGNHTDAGYLIAESDTLSTVTARGASTSASIILSNGAPFRFTSTGTGTFNQAVLYHNYTDGFFLENSWSDDSVTGTRTPISFGWRGGIGYGGLRLEGKTKVLVETDVFTVNHQDTYALGVRAWRDSTYVEKLIIGRTDGNSSRLLIGYDIAGTENAYINRDYETARLNFNRGGTTDMVLTGEGRLLVGASADLTSQRLQVNGYIDITSGTGAIRMYDGTTYAGGLGTADWAFGSTNLSTHLGLIAQNKLIIGAGAATMWMTTDFMVGIGTDSPSYKLHVAGNGYFSDSLTIDNGRFVVKVNETTNQGGLTVRSDDAGGHLSYSVTNSQHPSGWGWQLQSSYAEETSGAVYFRVGYGGANSYINAGNFGIGETSPNYKLHVGGTGRFTGALTFSGADRGFEADVSGGISFYSNEINSGSQGVTGDLYFGWRRTNTLNFGPPSKFVNYVGSTLGSGGIYFSGDASPDFGYIGYNYTNVNGTESVYQSIRESWRIRFGNGATKSMSFGMRVGSAAESAWSEYLSLASGGAATFSSSVNLNNGVLNLGNDSVASYVNSIGDVLVFDVDSNANTGGAPNMQFKVSGSTKAFLNSTGLGIGTTSPGAKLHIVGDTGGVDSIARFQNTNAAKVTRLQLLDSAGNVGDALIAYNHSNADSQWHYLGLGVNNSTSLIVNNNGFVGIGTTSPVSKLHVVGDGDTVTLQKSNNIPALAFLGTSTNKSVIEGGNDFGLYTGGSKRMTIGLDGAMGFNYPTLGVRSFMFRALSGRPLVAEFADADGIHSTYIRPNVSGANLITSNYLSGGVYLPLSLSGRESVGDLFLGTNGNIGIGTTSPNSKLHVNGRITINNPSSTGGQNTDQAIYIQHPSQPAEYFTMGFKDTSRSGEQMQHPGGPYYNSQAFYIECGSTEAGGICLDQDSVHVYGSSDGGATFRVIDKDADLVTFEMLQSSWNGVFRGDVIAYGSMSSLSDKRIKTNIEPYENTLDRLCSLGVYSYNKITAPKDKKDRKEIGVIAQEVQEVFPELVGSEKVSKPSSAGGLEEVLTVDYEHLTAILLQSIKELRQEVNELKSIINGSTK